MSLQYQSHSQTSQEAAEKNTTAKSHRLIIYKAIKNSSTTGKIADEIAELFNLNPNVVSPRLGELEADGVIVKLAETRHTRSNRKANVYVLPNWTLEREVLPAKVSQKEVLENLRREVDYYKSALLLIEQSNPTLLEPLAISLKTIAAEGIRKGKSSWIPF